MSLMETTLAFRDDGTAVRVGIDDGGPLEVLARTDKHIAVKAPRGSYWSGIGARSYAPPRIKVFEILRKAKDNPTRLVVREIIEWAAGEEATMTTRRKTRLTGFERTEQCAACPWKKSTDPHRDIPGGYDPEKHAALARCKSGIEELYSGRSHVMACHDSPARAPQACVGWVVQQLGDGNNLHLRILASTGAFDPMALRTEGEQHESLEAMCATAVAVEIAWDGR